MRNPEKSEEKDISNSQESHEEIEKPMEEEDRNGLIGGIEGEKKQNIGRQESKENEMLIELGKKTVDEHNQCKKEERELIEKDERSSSDQTNLEKLQEKIKDAEGIFDFNKTLKNGKNENKEAYDLQMRKLGEKVFDINKKISEEKERFSESGLLEEAKESFNEESLRDEGFEGENLDKEKQERMARYKVIENALTRRANELNKGDCLSLLGFESRDQREQDKDEKNTEQAFKIFKSREKTKEKLEKRGWGRQGTIEFWMEEKIEKAVRKDIKKLKNEQFTEEEIEEEARKRFEEWKRQAREKIRERVIEEWKRNGEDVESEENLERIESETDEKLTEFLEDERFLVEEKFIEKTQKEGRSGKVLEKIKSAGSGIWKILLFPFVLLFASILKIADRYKESKK